MRTPTEGGSDQRTRAIVVLQYDDRCARESARERGGLFSIFYFRTRARGRDGGGGMGRRVHRIRSFERSRDDSSYIVVLLLTIIRP